MEAEALTAQPAPSVDEFALYNSAGVYGAYVHTLEGGQREASLIVEGIHCAGCVRSIEQGLLRAGAQDARVNLGTHRAWVRWDESTQRLGGLLAALHALGYESRPYDPATQETAHRRQRRLALARLGVAGFGAANVMLYSVALYAGYFYGIDPGVKRGFQAISGAIALAVLLFSGWPFLRGAWFGLRHWRFNMDTLISLAMLAAFGYSTAVLVAMPGRETYFETVVMIIFFLLIGRFLESVARGRSSDITEQLAGLQVRWATRVEPGAEEVVPIQALRPGDVLRVRAGEAIPTDGEVLEGDSELDESALTGESLPRAVGPGSAVLGGTLNAGAPLLVRSRRVGADTVLARICRLVEEAQQRKAPLQGLADRIAGHFAAVVLGLAGATFAWWQWLAPGRDHPAAWLAAMAVLIIACPCALGLATPLAVLAGSSRAARRGVLIKGGQALEEAAHVTDVVLDKTGTVTTGRLEVFSVGSLGGLPPGSWLPLAAALERHVVHPLATALLAHVRAQGLAPAPHLETQSVTVLPGQGAQGMVAGEAVLVGNARLLQERGVPLPALPALPDSGTRIFVAVGGAAAGWLALEDPLRPDAAQAVSALQALGVTVHLFSGDRDPAVQAAARAVGIADARGEMLPDAKLQAIRALQAQGRVVAMVGDGLNDAPALAQAQVAMAVSTGSDLALQAAQVILVGARLMGCVQALDIARRTVRTIRENVGLSILYNAIAIPLAMAGWVIPLVAAGAMSASSLLVVLNALRLREWGRDPLSAPGTGVLPLRAPGTAAAAPAQATAIP